ncbi:MAG: hypothetical protein L0154_10800 [Chloroflexi bacterium]|nr:hypothetical protein [Chloroflexota bacterium]
MALSTKYTSRPLWTILVVIIIVMAFFVRVRHLNDEAVWHDEGWSIRAIQSPFGTPDDNTPYAYYTTLHLLHEAGTGDSPFALRFGSVLIDLVTVALAMLIGRQWFDELVALGGGVLVAFSPLMWEYAQEIRAYVAVPLFALAMLAIAERLLKPALHPSLNPSPLMRRGTLRRPEATFPLHIRVLAERHRTQPVVPPPQGGGGGRRSEGVGVQWHWWVLLFVVQFIGIYTHNLVVPVVVWMNLAVGVVWLYRRDWNNLLKWSFVETLLVISYLPWLSTQSPSGTALNTTPTLGYELAIDIWQGYFLPGLAQHQMTDDRLLINLFGVLMVVLLVIFVATQRTVKTWLLASQVLLVPLVSALLIISANIDFHPRYFVAAVPATLLMMAAALYSLKPVHGYAIIGIVVLGVFIGATSINDVNNSRIFQHDDFESLAEYYATLPETAVIVVPYDREPALQNYYAQQLDIKARFVNIPLYSDEETVLEHLRRIAPLEGERHVEFLTWFQLPADVRGMYPCILTASVKDPLGEAQIFYGLATQPYQLTKAPAFDSLLARPEYDPLVFRGAGYISSRQGICVRNNWTLPQETTTDYNVAMTVIMDEFELAREDSPITLDNQVPTSEWEAGQTGSSYTLLRLPPGAPRQPYDLIMRVYTEQDVNGIQLLGESVGVQGTDYQFPEAQTYTGPQIIDPPQTPMVVTDNAPNGMLDGTEPLRVSLIINGIETNDLNLVSIRLEGDDWVSHASSVYDGAAIRTWETFDIPPEAQGEARLTVDDMVIATYQIYQVERLFSAPPAELEVNEKFPGVGNLIGASLSDRVIDIDEGFSVELVWQANTATDIAYTVFVQLLSADDVVIAQSDQQPAGNTRPTTNWASGEFIIDNHQLTFRVDNYEGDAKLIVGFYDEATGNRVLTGEGNDYVQLPVELKIKP